METRGRVVPSALVSALALEPARWVPPIGLADGEKIDNGADAPWTKKFGYTPIFVVPADPWKIDASWDDAYFDSAKHVLEAVVRGELHPRIEGLAGVAKPRLGLSRHAARKRRALRHPT